MLSVPSQKFVGQIAPARSQPLLPPGGRCTTWPPNGVAAGSERGVFAVALFFVPTVFNGSLTRDTRRCRGFSLLEVLVAFVILALVAIALFRLFSGGLTNASAAGDWSRALMLAETQLELAASTQPLLEGVDRGVEDDGRMQWETRVGPYIVPNADPEVERSAETLPMRLYRVIVDVKFPGQNGGERTLSLATVKLSARNP